MATDSVIMCGRCRRLYNSISGRKCPHPKVQEFYGDYICASCCRTCKNHIKFQLHGGIACGYTGGDING